MGSPTICISLKLVIDSTSQKVVYAQAGKDFVDFLFNILSLPVGSVMRLVTRPRMVGCVANLFGSIGILDDPEELCMFCNNVMNRNVAWDSCVTYMIMDDLKVRHMSSSYITNLLKSFNVQVLEEKVIEMGLSQGIELVLASLQSETVLTDVFLGQKAGENDSE
ncbi:hypothetical protein V6N11_070587 [Hibiscus sabdariffa]|uniref:Uncharacterized protein n=1 Tax=Hibiscus sabdariffa TaxID=183260 RepID=A0ABR2QFW2_9ROSI